MTGERGLFKSTILQSSKWLAMIPACALLAGCPPLIVPHFTTSKYGAVYSIPDDPRPWLTLENDGISLYLYQECDHPKQGCRRQKLVALKRGTRPDWKPLLDANLISWRVQDLNAPMRRPISAYVPGTRYRFMGTFGHYPEITFAIPTELVSSKAMHNRYTQLEDFNDIVYPADIDVQLVIYDDDHQWIFSNQPNFKSDGKKHPTDLFIPAKLFRFDTNDDARLHRPMALYYVSTVTRPIGYRVIAGHAVESQQNKTPRLGHWQIALADITFPSSTLKLDTATADTRTVAGQPTLACDYSHTQFNLGWMDEAHHSPPSEAYRNGCEPYQPPPEPEGK
ncbi:hypothetical protein [Burkholderia lata]|uniref:hypothetical protein n=1 Tax=Burkholderia lata (strain ATCC 17760 / DSM 23089 / LMG 22485 / NCIMB 9086 / R18194 / 383) TaxID=482957 RepID=UPI001582493F|nr:hypothetical protein [Burkholderia lata]